MLEVLGDYAYQSLRHNCRFTRLISYWTNRNGSQSGYHVEYLVDFPKPPAEHCYSRLTVTQADDTVVSIDQPHSPKYQEAVQALPWLEQDMVSYTNLNRQSSEARKVYWALETLKKESIPK